MGGNLSNSFKLNKPGQQLGWRKQLRLMLFFWICLPRKVLSRLIDFSIWIISTKLSQFALKIYHGYWTYLQINLLDNADRFFSKSVSLRNGGQFDSDLEEVDFESVKVMVTGERRSIEPRDQSPESVENVCGSRHRARADLFLGLIIAGPEKCKLVKEGSCLAA